MAKKSDIKAPASSMRRGSTGKVFVWIILVLLILGLAGFGANSLGGSISAIGSVGKTEITTNDFFRALQQELEFESRRRGEQVSIQQARNEGIDQRVLDRLAALAALSEETKAVELSVGDAEVAAQLRAVQAFHGPTGTFDRDRYEFALQQNGTRPSEFEEQLRTTAARNVLQQAITGGLTVSETYANTLYGYVGERRSFRWAIIDESLLTEDIAEPSDTDLESFHGDNGDLFRTAEIRNLTYVWLTPDMLLETIEVDEKALQDRYEERSAAYNQPERRLIEQLGFASMEAATEAKTQIEAGDITFEQLVEERGLTLRDVDQGEVSRDDLDSDVVEVVFGVTEPGLSDPVQTSLGPVLYRINAVLEATTVTFESARPELLAEFQSDRARRIIDDEITVIDDLLVGGATLEELADETPMELSTLAFTADTFEGIAGYDSFRAEVAALTTSDFPEVKELSDGSIFAVRLDEIVAPMVPPLADIRDIVSNAWREDQVAQKLAALGSDFAEQVRGGTRMASLNLAAKAEVDMDRNGFIEGAPRAMVTEIFELEENGVTFVQGPDGQSALVEITDISAPDMSTEQARAITGQLNSIASNGLAGDVFELFGQAVQTRHGLSLDQAAVNAVLSQVGGGGNSP